ncbi:MFS transporter [Nocardioides sp. WV_118_6]
MPVALVALAIGGFGIGLTEFVIMGLLPEVADDFAVTETTAGYLISGYALSVAVGAIVLTLALTRVPRKTALLGLMVLFILGNLISALAPDYATMMSGRVVAALCHGAFFGIGSVVAAQLVAPERKASAIAFMFGGFTYIAFTLTEVSGFASGAVPLLLVLFGAGMVAGNVLGGRAADRNLVRTLLVVLAALIVVLAGFALTASSPVLTVIALVLMGGVGFATVPGLQMRVMAYADRAPTLASGANIAAFNVGNALGAWIGGLTLAAGLGYTSPLWAGAAITAAGLVVLVVAALAPGGELRRTPAPVATPVAA